MFAVLAMVSFHTFAQDLYKLETPYEKARAQLADEAIAKIMQNDIQLTLTMGVAISKMQQEEWSEWKQLEFGEDLIAKAWGAYNWLEPQTYSDYRTFGRIGPACEEYARKREALEKTKTDLDRERERMRNYKPPIGALSTVLISTRDNFVQLMKKGEFEKLAQFRQRVAETGPQTFDSIAYMLCMAHALASIKLEKRNYDVETEFDTMYAWHNEDYEVVGTAHLSPEMAQRVLRRRPDIQGDSMKICVVNGDVLPYKMSLSANNEQWQYVFHTVKKDAKMDTNIVFSVAKTGITDTNILQVMGNHVFDYNKIVAQKIAQAREKAAKEAEEKARKALAERLYDISRSLNSRGWYRDGYENQIPSMANIPDSVVKMAYLSILEDYKSTTNISLPEYITLFETIRKECRYKNDAEGYVIANNISEKDVERIEKLYGKYELANSYIKSIVGLENTLHFLERYNYNNNLFSIKLKGSSSSYGYYSVDNNSGSYLKSEMEQLRSDVYSTKAYYVLVQWIVETNKGARMEWNKHKDKYNDIVEFYEHYTSEAYKPRK